MYLTEELVWTENYEKEKNMKVPMPCYTLENAIIRISKLSFGTFIQDWLGSWNFIHLWP